jgi:class 3 adenylate cyclase
VSARELPTGTVTSLFTDVEGSTRLIHEQGAGWPFGDAVELALREDAQPATAPRATPDIS